MRKRTTGWSKRRRAWMLRVILPVALCVFALKCQAQEKDFAARPITPESQFLELIDLEGDAEKQLTLMELFLVQFPKYDALAALYSDMQSDCIKLEKWDRALQIGDKLLAIDQDDVEAVKLNLTAATGKKDEGLIKKWKDRLAQLNIEPSGSVSATSTIATPYVEGSGAAGESPNDPQRASKQVRARMEASLFNRALQESDPGVRIKILDQFAKDFPQSIHLNKVNYLFFVAYRQAGDEGKSLQVAEQILQKDQTHEDVLAYVADTYFKHKRELDKVLTYSAMLLDLVTGKPKPEGISEQEWARQRATVSYQAHWMAGTVHIYREQWGAADRELRVTLQLHPGGDQTTAGILTSLAWANYKLKNIPESIRFYEQCAKIPGPYQAAASQSIVSIKSEYGLP